MDAILLRSLPVPDPRSLVAMKWQSRPPTPRRQTEFVMHSMDGSTYDDRSGVDSGHLPVSGVRAPAGGFGAVLSSLFAHKQAGGVNVIDQGPGRARAGRVRLRRLLSAGSQCPPAAGRLICRRRRSRRRRAGRGPEPGLQRAALRRCRQRHRAADSHQQRAVHRGRRDALRVLRRRSGGRAAGLSPDARQSALRFDPGGRARVPSTRTTTGSR